MRNIEELLALSARIDENYKKITADISNAQIMISSAVADYSTKEEEIKSRENNVIKMEMSLRKHMDDISAVKGNLSQAKEKESTALLKIELLENEKQELEEKIETLEVRCKDFLEKITMLEGENAKLLVSNQKLSIDKARLLKTRLEEDNE